MILRWPLRHVGLLLQRANDMKAVFASIWKRKPKLFHLICVRILWYFFRAAELIHALHIIRVRRTPNPINRELNTFSMIYWLSKLIFSHCINKNGPVFSLSLCYINASESLLRIFFLISFHYSNFILISAQVF